MTSPATRFQAIRRGSFGWRSIAWIVLLAFALQSYVIQTHIHGAPQMAGAASVTKDLATSSGHNKLPSEDGTIDCPFCQAVVHSGVFFAPVAPLLVLPATWTERVVLPIFEGTAGVASTHGWRSRAPPRR